MLYYLCLFLPRNDLGKIFSVILYFYYGKFIPKSEVLICREYVTFAEKVKLRVTTSATPTVKREERLKQTFRKFPM